MTVHRKDREVLHCCHSLTLQAFQTTDHQITKTVLHFVHIPIELHEVISSVVYSVNLPEPIGVQIDAHTSTGSIQLIPSTVTTECATE